MLFRSTLARELGAPCITTEPGGPVEAGASWARSLDLFVEEIKPVLEHAERERVKLLVEPEPGLLIETSEQAMEFMGRFSSPWLGLNFDIGHSYCVGEDPARVVPMLAPHIGHVHLEDIASTRVHHHMVPGTGAIDFEAVDDQPVELVFLLLAPETAGADHLKALARISRLLRDKETCEKLRGSDTADALYALLTDTTTRSAA